MLVFDWRGKPDDPAFEAMLARLRMLVADMEAVRGGLAEKDLPADAPGLDRWRLAQRPVPCLVGRSTGHPHLPGEGREIVTSDLWLISADGQWARTLSRWYRLGTADGHERTDTWRQ